MIVVPRFAISFSQYKHQILATDGGLGEEEFFFYFLTADARRKVEFQTVDKAGLAADVDGHRTGGTSQQGEGCKCFLAPGHDC